MQQLSEIRAAAGPRQTVGLPDAYIGHFLVRDINLNWAIQNAYRTWKGMANEAQSTYKQPEKQLCDSIFTDWCVFYPPETRNPYVPLASKGPWIVTLHGAVLHDSGGYGMMGLGHSPKEVMAAMATDFTMANIMTPMLAQKKFISTIKKEIGRNRGGVCPFGSFLMMNSGSEGNTVADRIIDMHTGEVMSKKPNQGKGWKVKCIALKGCFHGRTYKPAIWTDSCREAYTKHKAHSIVHTYAVDYVWNCEPNNLHELQALFDKAKMEQVYIEAMFMESVMGEGNPGQAMTPEFFSLARKLTLEHDSMLLVDNIQAGLRTTGNLSIVDYPGFEQLPEPDFEVYSKAINAGQYPVSCLALSKRAEKFYKHGVYGNTMTGNARACAISTCVLESITDDVRKNIVDMGKYAVNEYTKLMHKHPKVITAVSGTGLLYAVQLNKELHTVVSMTGAEMTLRWNGIGVIHGGDNALRFTPHFKITKEEMDMQIDFVRALVEGIDYRTLAPPSVGVEMPAYQPPTGGRGVNVPSSGPGYVPASSPMMAKSKL